MSLLTKKHDTEKKIRLSFIMKSNDHSTTTAATTIQDNSLGKDKEKCILSVIITQKTAYKVFEEDSFIRVALSAKINNPERYKGWSILQQDSVNNDVLSLSSSSKNTKREAIGLSDVVKEYYELPITIPKEQFTELAVKCVGNLLVTDDSKQLLSVITKEEMLSVIYLCSYLGVKP